jgi:hypothetical protein
VIFIVNKYKRVSNNSHQSINRVNVGLQLDNLQIILNYITDLVILKDRAVMENLYSKIMANVA